MDLISNLQPIYLYILGVMVFAGIVHGGIGIGFPMVSTPLIAVFMDVRQAILVTLLPTVLVNIASIWCGTDQKSSLREYAPMYAYAMVGSFLGAYMLITMDPSPFRLALALLIIIYLWTTYNSEYSFKWVRSESPIISYGFGLAAGISGGITNVMIAILVIYFLSLSMPRSKMVPIFNIFFLIGKLSQIIVLSIAGLVSTSLISEAILPGVAALAGLWVGNKIGRSMSKELFQKLLHLLLITLSIILITQFFTSIKN